MNWNEIRIILQSHEWELGAIGPDSTHWDRTPVVRYVLSPTVQRLLNDCGLELGAGVKLSPDSQPALERELIIVGHQSEARYFFSRLRQFRTLITFPLHRDSEIFNFLDSNAVGDYCACGTVGPRGAIYLSDEQDAHLTKLTLSTTEYPIEVREAGVALLEWEKTNKELMPDF